MVSPFPGMDPYLEDRNIWSGFHHSLAEKIEIWPAVAVICAVYARADYSWRLDYSQMEKTCQVF